jgi:integrase
VKDGSQHLAPQQPPKFLDQLRRCIRDKHYSHQTERIYVFWARWYIRFHGVHHPADMDEPEVQAFLSYLSNERHCSVSTHHQASCALLFLYKQVLNMELPWMDNVSLTKPVRKPTMLTREELEMIFAQMEGVHLLIARLLYGTGMRLMECAQLPGQGCGFLKARNHGETRQRVE